MRVIGTAGHVDHGKTTLIEALTGINPDRLPEEKARGMTIDLGFAWFSVPGGEPVGVIDVPGHERFIRNMVAGAWSLDCALLLVAADDGWMQQTQDHAVVLSSLGVRGLILVVTKTDAASAERIAAVRRDGLARCAKIFGAEPSSIEVSALSGRNVDSLKELIVRTLAGLPGPSTDAGFPFLYIDRVFSIKGSGLVVTGSLKGGALGKDDELVLLPQREALRVRGVQCYNEQAQRALPTSRVALNLQKTKSEIARGNCVTSPGAPFSCEREIVARVYPVEEHSVQPADGAGEPPVIRNHSEVEIALGTGHEIALLHFMDDRRFARIQLTEPLPALWNQPFLVIRQGGSTILGSGRILWFGEVPKEERRRLAGLLAALPDPARGADRLSLALRYHGLLKLGDGVSLDPALVPETVTLDPWVFHAPWLEKLAAGIRALAGEPAGASAGELESKLRIDAEALKRVLALMAEKNELVVSNTLYFTPRQGEEQELSAAARRLQAEIQSSGKAGFDSNRTGIEGAQKELKTLVRLGLVVPLEGGICYSRQVYDELSSAVMTGRKEGDRFSIPEAKERTGLSRKYMIPLLNRMEKDGLLRRDGDLRLVL